MKNLFFTLLMLPSLLNAQNDEWAQVQIKINPISKNIAYLEGRGGNIGVIYTNEAMMISMHH
jgi:hypothetical protein